LGDPSNRIEIDASPIVTTHERHAPPAANDLHDHLAGRVLCRRLALLLTLYAVGHRVTYDLDERCLHCPEYLGIDPYVAPSRLERNLFAHDLRRVSDDSVERSKNCVGRDEPYLFDPITSLPYLAFESIQRMRQGFFNCGQDSPGRLPKRPPRSPGAGVDWSRDATRRNADRPERDWVAWTPHPSRRCCRPACGTDLNGDLRETVQYQVQVGNVYSNCL
jgi:hypothetical protein